ncbi:MAG: DUF4440 domain-containing protein [Verrucomicrobiota bacterium]
MAGGHRVASAAAADPVAAGGRTYLIQCGGCHAISDAGPNSLGPRLDAIFADDLYYAHSSGKIDRKASYMKGLVARTSLYRSFDYKTRTFSVVAPGLALMTGRVLIGLGSAEKPTTNDVNFLAVYRQENGRWRFLSWQACKNLPPATRP